MKKLKRNFVVISTMLLFVCIVMAAYHCYATMLRPTRIGFINYPDYLYAGFAGVNENRFIKVERLEWKDGKTPDLTRFDVVYIFGMGLRLSSSQQGELREAIRAGLQVYVGSATSEENDLTTLSGKKLETVQSYLDNGGPENFRQLLNYSRRVIDGKKMFSATVKPVVKIPFDCLFHIDDGAIFETVAEYMTYYRNRGLYKEGAPKVCFISTNAGPSSARRDHLNAIISSLEKENFNVFPLCGFRKRFDYLNEIKPDLVILMPHGRFSAGDGDLTISWLKERNIPLLCPVNVFQPYDQWLKDQRSMTGGLFSQSVVMPELDGGIVPYALTAQFPNHDGLNEFKAIPERLPVFSTLVRRFVDLKRKANHDKKIAVVYFKGPGQNALNASGLEVGESLFNFLKKLRDEGYNVDGLPDSAAELLQKIQRHAAVFGPYAKGAEQRFMAEAEPELVTVADYLQWVKKSIPADLYTEVEKQYGAAPGPYLSTSRNSVPVLVVSRLRFGNVVIMPQPMAGYGDDTAKIVHGTKAAPPHPYIGAYLWIQHGFKADALIHFGTHGSLEFTPWKQVALSQYDWPDILVGALPHFYLYTINNIGEAMIAKRRSYATIISHLTPPFMSAGLYDELSELHDKIHHYSTTADALLRQQYAKSITTLLKKLNLSKDLQLPELSQEQSLPEEILEKIHNYLHGIEEAKISRGAYVLGRSYSKDEAEETALLMTIDTLAKALADIDLMRGKITEKQKDDRHFFELQYRTKAERAIRAALKGESLPELFISASDRQILQEKSNDRSDKSVNLMGIMMSMQADAADVGKNKTAVPPLTDHELRQLLLRLGSDPERMKFVESLRQPATLEKALSMTNPENLKKARRIAAFIPEMKKAIELAAHPDAQTLLKQMHIQAQKERIFALLAGGDFMKVIAAEQKKRDEDLARKCKTPEYQAALQLATDHPKLEKLLSPVAVTDAATLQRQLVELKLWQERWIFLQSQSTVAGEKTEALNNALKVIAPVIATAENRFVDYLTALKNIDEALKNPQIYRDALLHSPQAELGSLLNALNGGYIAPSSGGDPLVNPRSVPTGKNLFAIDAERTPNREAWETGKQLAEALFAVTLKKEKRYPHKAAFTLWGGEFIRSQGVEIAEILYLLGVEPVWNSRGTITDVRLIPMDRLKRPRIDVVVQTSGQFRDAAASRLYLIDKAVRLAAAADDGNAGINYVREGAVAAEKKLLTEGLSPLEARNLATARIFGGVNGNYGTGITGMVEAGDRWENSEEIAGRYLQNMGAIYTQDRWSEFVPGAMAAALQNTDTVIQPRSSNTTGPISLDHVYEFMGGINLAVRKETGKEPATYFNDLRQPGKAVLQDAREAAMTEARSTVLNPRYIEEMMKEGPSSAGTFAETFRNIYGWEVMKPELLDDYLWQDLKEVYIDDRHKLGVKEYFNRKNPAALQEMTAVMLETIRKGYWKADMATQKQIAALHVQLVKQHGPGCSGFVCDNAKLRGMIGSLLDDKAAKQQYEDAVDKIRNPSVSGNEKVSGMRLEKEEHRAVKSVKEMLKNNILAVIICSFVVLLLLLSILIGRKKTPEI